MNEKVLCDIMPCSVCKSLRYIKINHKSPIYGTVECSRVLQNKHMLRCSSRNTHIRILLVNSLDIELHKACNFYMVEWFVAINFEVFTSCHPFLPYRPFLPCHPFLPLAENLLWVLLQPLLQPL